MSVLSYIERNSRYSGNWAMETVGNTGEQTIPLIRMTAYATVYLTPTTLWQSDFPRPS